MIRADMVATVGREYLVSNIENDEYSYPKAYRAAALSFTPIQNSSGRTYEKLDIRFVKDNISVLIETKPDFRSNIEAWKEQLSAYVEYEKGLTGNKIIAILANTEDDSVMVWRGVVSDGDFMPKETALRTMDEYVDFYISKVNDKEKVMQNTYKLNELLHRHSIPEKLRSQFVGTCLLALKNGLDYSTPSLTPAQIRTRIKEVLEGLLNSDINRAEKLALLNRNVLDDQYVRQLNIAAFREILAFIETNILPFINDKSTSGQDLLNLFFVTFNKYVGKSDKNQAFTPDHITDFMAKVAGVNKRSVVLDPCCGSGSFLVRAMTQALDDCATAAEQEKIKKHQIFGIEFDENIYGLATTNMLIHSDGNSNIRRGSCFALADWIKEAKPNVILMNPPYNGQRIHLPDRYVRTWPRDKKEDPSKGFYFVKYIAELLNSENISATLAVLLPVACAIGTSGEIAKIKTEILRENTLKAVFTLPNEIFYPGASASACCMVFEIGKRHDDSPYTFFGYYKDDGFKKKKNLGRVEQTDTESGKSKWVEIERKWLDAYKRNDAIDGFSAVHKVSGSDEWLCEAYMKTDYSSLCEADFQQILNDYLSYLVKSGKYPTLLYTDSSAPDLNVLSWEEFVVGDYFEVKKGKRLTSDDQTEGSTLYIGAIGSNNGVANKIGQEPIHEGNTISLSYNGSVGEAFYQPEPFWATDDVNVLYFRSENGVAFNTFIGLFICTVLRQEKYRYSYGRKWVLENMKTTVIKLPAKEDRPDWAFMENYMKSLPYGDSI